MLFTQRGDLGADTRRFDRVQRFLVHPSERPATAKPAHRA
jgi:hypothetical protein